MTRYANTGLLAGVLVATVACGAHAQAQESYPARPITLVIMTGPGTAGDIIARALVPGLMERLKQPVVIEFRTGASGIIAADFVAKSAPNGYTLLSTVNTSTVLQASGRTLPWDLLTDFTHVTKLFTVALAYGANVAMPGATLKDLVDAVRANPGKYTFGSPGNGTPHHLAGELFQQGLGLQMVHVPHKELSQAYASIVGGHVDTMTSAVASYATHMKSGRVKLLAITGPARLAMIPEVPTFRELGYDFMSDVDGWYMLSAPAKTPAPIVERLNREFRAVLNTAEAREALVRFAGAPDTTTPEEAVAFLKKDIERWSRVIRQGKISVN